MNYEIVKLSNYIYFILFFVILEFIIL